MQYISEIDVYRPRVIIYCEDQEFMFRFYYDSFKTKIHIDVCVDYFSTSPYFTDFRLFRKSYVYENLREIVCVWTRLNINYKSFKYCDNILKNIFCIKKKTLRAISR